MMEQKRRADVLQEKLQQSDAVRAPQTRTFPARAIAPPHRFV